MIRPSPEAGPLSAAELMAEATYRTGLDDWGGDRGFTEPLGLLIDSCAATGRLNAAGWRVLHSVLVRHLRNRLHLQAYRRRHPEVVERPLGRPVVITGLPRTGTTLLHNLLAQDPQHRFLRLWEALHPVPAEESPEGDEAALVQKAQRWLERFNAHAPGFRTVHPLTAHGPEECDRLLQNAFASQHFVDMFDVEAYARWFYQDTLGREYAYYAQQLQSLTREDDAHRRWLLKSPGHLPHLPELFEALPGAVVVHCHRDPVEAVPSYASLIVTVRGPNSDETSPFVAGDQALERCSAALERAWQARRSGAAPRVLDVSYPRLVDDPLTVVEEIYHWLDEPLEGSAEDAMRQWLDEHPRHRHGVHHYDPGAFRLPNERIDAAFAEYYRRCGRLVGRR